MRGSWQHSLIPVALRGVTDNPKKTLQNMPVYTSPILITLLVKTIDISQEALFGKSQSVSNRFLFNITFTTLFGYNAAYIASSKFNDLGENYAKFIKSYGNCLTYFPVRLIDYEGIFKPAIFTVMPSIFVPQYYRELVAGFLLSGLTSSIFAAAKVSTFHIASKYRGQEIESSYDKTLQRFKQEFANHFCVGVAKLALKSYGYEGAFAAGISGIIGAGCVSIYNTNFNGDSSLSFIGLCVSKIKYDRDKIYQHGAYEFFSSLSSINSPTGNLTFTKIFCKTFLETFILNGSKKVALGINEKINNVFSGSLMSSSKIGANQIL
jgi:hypothetical protein